jgi:NAD(P)-dependent dehydrogenase (short-subunit alcohol dehydrogenase family)
MSVAVISGGGRGLGRGIARALAADGFDLVLGWTNDEAAVKETLACSEAAGRRAVAVQGDVSRAETAADLRDAALGLGGLDAWINNAGVSVLAPVVSTDPADLERMLAVNVTGVLHGMQAAARWWLAGERAGRIINIASDLGVQACPYLGGYTASKFAVVGLTQTAALELAGAGIAVNAVCPGTAETDMVLAERDSEVQVTGLSPDDVRAGYLAAIPAGRFCTPDDVGVLAAFLCSPGATYITGQAICVNGGSILH